MNSKIRSFISCLCTLISLTGLGSAAQGAIGGLTLSTKSLAGRDMDLHFSQDAVTSAVKSAVVCTSQAIDVSQAKLWMPDMGHGSSPTALVRQDAFCTRVDRLNFLMPGDWELRVTLVDGDSGVFTFNVAE